MKNRLKRTNWIIGLVCAAPVILLLEMKLFTEITSLIREQSDISVMIGFTLIAIGLFLNFLLTKLIINKTIKTK
jgi:hypothetical protein